MNTKQISAEKQAILDMAAKHGITMEAVFVPWGLSRNSKEKDCSLNWTITLFKDKRKMIQTDYMAGNGHCPSYTLGHKKTLWENEQVKDECQTGKSKSNGKSILPDLADVIHSLVIDSEVLDCPCYEQWAENFGYDSDSRKGEKIYRACLEIALQLRASLGEKALAEFVESCNGY